MTICQKLGMILENKFQALKLENNVFNKKWSSKFTFFFINSEIF